MGGGGGKTFHLMCCLPVVWTSNDVWTLFRSFTSVVLALSPGALSLRITIRRSSTPPATLTEKELQTELNNRQTIKKLTDEVKKCLLSLLNILSSRSTFDWKCPMIHKCSWVQLQLCTETSCLAAVYWVGQYKTLCTLFFRSWWQPGRCMVVAGNIREIK